MVRGSSWHFFLLNFIGNGSASKFDVNVQANLWVQEEISLQSVLASLEIGLMDMK